MANNRSFSSLFNLQSTSINFNFGHLSAKYQGYSLTFWPIIAHFHHFSICNQNQSISILVICRQNTKVIALLFGQNRSFSSLFNLQSKSINFNFGHFRQNTKVIALLFGQKSLIFITFQSAININQFQFCHLLAKYQGYSLTFWPIIAHFHHFSICNQNQSISILVICRQNTKVIALLFGQNFHHFSICNQNQSISIWSFSAKYQGYSLTFWPKSLIFINLQSTSINFNFDHFNLQSNVNQFQFVNFGEFSAKYQGYTFWPKIHFSSPNQNRSFSSLIALQFGQSITFQSASINFNFCHLSAKYQGYSLTFWPKIAHFHHFSLSNQHQSISIFVICRQNTRLSKSLISITCQSPININQIQF